MDDVTRTLADLERLREELHAHALDTWARVIALDAEIKARRAGIQPATEFAKASLTDAVEQVLRSTGAAMTPSQIHQQLQARGRHDEPRSIGGTLQHLKRSKRAVQVARGQWLATT